METVAIVGVPPELSRNPPDTPTIPCSGCGAAVSFDARSTALLAQPQHDPWCLRCAADRWPDMEIAGTEGVWLYEETVAGVSVGTIRVGRLRIRDYLAGAVRVPESEPEKE